MKPVVFQGQARKELKNFPADARRELGKQIMRLQAGLNPEDSKPMRTIGFEKKTQKTTKLEIDKAKFRFSILRKHRGTL